MSGWVKTRRYRKSWGRHSSKYDRSGKPTYSHDKVVPLKLKSGVAVYTWDHDENQTVAVLDVNFSATAYDELDDYTALYNEFRFKGIAWEMELAHVSAVVVAGQKPAPVVYTAMDPYYKMSSAMGTYAWSFDDLVDDVTSTTHEFNGRGTMSIRKWVPGVVCTRKYDSVNSGFAVANSFSIEKASWDVTNTTEATVGNHDMMFNKCFPQVIYGVTGLEAGDQLILTLHCTSYFEFRAPTNNSNGGRVTVSGSVPRPIGSVVQSDTTWLRRATFKIQGDYFKLTTHSGKVYTGACADWQLRRHRFVPLRSGAELKCSGPEDPYDEDRHEEKDWPDDDPDMEEPDPPPSGISVLARAGSLERAFTNVGLPTSQPVRQAPPRGAGAR